MDNELKRIWQEQVDFNANFRTAATLTNEQRVTETKEIVLHLFSEMDELLRASGAWKPHRRVPDQAVNRRAIGLELADGFKYLLTVAEINGFTMEEFVAFFWEKSMVVRQRYSQEFVQTLDRPAIVVDIDNVLADYIRCFSSWLYQSGYITDGVRRSFKTSPRYIDAKSLGLSEELYREAKHRFRISGWHATMDVKIGAIQFLNRACWDGARAIILLTARPIRDYPNLFSETLSWLQLNHLPFNMVWWADNKAEAIDRAGILDKVVFAVDDEWQYVEQFAKAGVKTYWLGPSIEEQNQRAWALDQYPHVQVVRDLDHITFYEEVDK